MELLRFARVFAAVLCMAGAAAFAQTPAASEETRNIDVSEELESGFIASPEERADYYLKNENYEKLLTHAKKWTENYPGDSNAWNYLAQALRAKNQIVESADAFNRAWELSNKRDFRIKESIGDIYFQEKEWEKAVDAYKAALELNDTRPSLWEKYTDSVLIAQPPAWRSSAAAGLKKMLSFGEYVNNAERWRQYTDILEMLNTDIDTLYSAYRHIVRLTVRDIGAWERLYDIETERGHEGEKEKIVRILYRIEPENALANLHYGLDTVKKNPRDARKYLEIALKGEKLSETRRAQIYVIFGDMEKSPASALRHYQTAVQHDPANIGAWEKAIVRLRSLGRRYHAQKVYEHLLQLERKIQRKQEITPIDAEILLRG